MVERNNQKNHTQIIYIPIEQYRTVFILPFIQQNFLHYRKA